MLLILAKIMKLVLGPEPGPAVTNLPDLTDHQWSEDHRLATAASTDKALEEASVR